MDSTSYKTEWWEGREVLPGSSMRFVQRPNIPKPLRKAVPRSGGNIAPLWELSPDGLVLHPAKPHRPTPESYTVADYLTGGDRRVEGQLRDALLRATRR